ncbi:hypothetical protein [Patulibacter minatonensis]|uniref:hypothetical protein n=1 Tax=Patulibacter minatonensis TaxID=298163 RepID=UPI00047987A4|nr:hypothetical protein [Patulibacter minatonensis]
MTEKEIHAIAQVLYYEDCGNWGYDPGKGMHRATYTAKARRIAEHVDRHRAAAGQKEGPDGAA